MPLLKLTDVPEHILDKPAGVKPGTQWQSEYNVAAWIRFDQNSTHQSKLYLVWLDELGEHRHCIDQCSTASASSLLSGIARIKVVGPLRSMSVALSTPQTQYHVDELYVQPVSRESSKPPTKRLYEM
jgi:hypothetical protein